jgi:hypothetical protein
MHFGILIFAYQDKAPSTDRMILSKVCQAYKEIQTWSVTVQDKVI